MHGEINHQEGKWIKKLRLMENWYRILCLWREFCDCQWHIKYYFRTNLLGSALRTQLTFLLWPLMGICWMCCYWNPKKLHIIEILFIVDELEANGIRKIVFFIVVEKSSSSFYACWMKRWKIIENYLNICRLADEFVWWCIVWFFNR